MFMTSGGFAGRSRTSAPRPVVVRGREQWLRGRLCCKRLDRVGRDMSKSRTANDLLADPIIRARFADGATEALSLPALYAALMADKVESFTALRPHQRHPWHALLCQLGALACLRAGLAESPGDAETWRAILRALTPGFPEGEPWRLVSPPEKPAFLQAPVGPLSGLNPLGTPDELDMLVTAKNHDVKGARLGQALPDDWLFALVALQTAEGFLGAGNFGVSRMNGGFANRPAVGLAPRGGVGAHVRRDISRMVALAEAIADAHDYDEDGPALLWLLPWDGAAQLKRRALHPFYIEICRRVRLAQENGLISAHVGGSKAARIAMAKEEAGVTGDPWTPIEETKEGIKSLTVDARGFDYRRLSAILFSNGFQPAPLQKFGPGEGGEGWTVLCRALARGQGKTEGYHERRVPVPPPLVARFRQGDVGELGGIAQERISQAGAVRSALRLGLMTLFQNGPKPEDYDPRNKSSSDHAEPHLDRLQDAIDGDFFERLFEEAQAEREGRPEARRLWLMDLLGRAEACLKAAEAGSPQSAVRKHQALVRADAALRRAFFGAKDLKDHLRREADAA
jgi:CRISPR system Cascade subunit CasA